MDQKELEIRQKVDFEMISDQVSAHRLALAWLMAKTCPEESDAWLARQIEEVQGRETLAEIGRELGLLRQDLSTLLAPREDGGSR